MEVLNIDVLETTVTLKVTLSDLAIITGAICVVSRQAEAKDQLQHHLHIEYGMKKNIPDEKLCVMHGNLDKALADAANKEAGASYY